LSLREENFWVYHFCIMHSFWKNVGQTGMDTQLLHIYLIIINFSFYLKCTSLSIIKGCCIFYLTNFTCHPSRNLYDTIWIMYFWVSMVVTVLSSSGWMYIYVSYEQGISIFSFKGSKDMMLSGYTRMLKVRWSIRLLFPIHQSYGIGPCSIPSLSLSQNLMSSFPASCLWNLITFFYILHSLTWTTLAACPPQTGTTYRTI